MPQRRYGKFRVWVYTSNERGHRPHVHAKSGSGEVSIFIEGGIEIRKISGMSKSDVSKALDVVAEHAEELLGLWSEYNG